MINFTSFTRVATVGLVPFLVACNEVSAPTAPEVEERCRVEEFKKLLWRPEAALEGVSLRNVRVIYPNTAVTMDFRPMRTNIVIGKSGRIERVYCG